MNYSYIKLKKWRFVILEFFSGFGFAILGDYIYSSFDKANLETSIFNSYLTIFIFMALGVVLMGYFHFRSIDKLKEFGKAIACCFIGLFLFIILYIILDLIAYKVIPDYINSIILPILMPLTGSVGGLNFLSRRVSP